MQVNYVREHERFIEYAADERLTPNEQLLWYALMHIFNQRAEGSEWPDGFIRITNDRLFTYLPIKWDAMAKARNALKQRGLIEFKGGNRNRTVPEYRMIWFYPSGCPFKTDNTGGNTGGNEGGNIGGNEGGNTGDIYNKLNLGINRNQREIDEDDDDVDVNRAGTDARDVGDPIEDRDDREHWIRVGFVNAFGRMPYPAEVQRLTVSSWMMGFGEIMIAKAMIKAAESGASNPAALTVRILDEWRANHVMQPYQVDEYQAEYDRMAGRNGLHGSGDVLEDLRSDEEAKRRRQEENRLAGIVV